MILLLLLASSFLYAVESETQQQSVVTLFFTCWYNTYEEGVRYRNAVFGYNNTFNAPLIINSTPPGVNALSVDNVVTNNVLTLFLQGSHPAALNVPRANSIAWIVGTPGPPVATQSVVTVNLALQDNSTMCWNLFNQTCFIVGETPIPNFCEDGNFCNNREFCAAGLCQRNNTPICPTSVCNETPPVCLPPTPSPTAAPTGVPTTLPPPTLAPSSAPTATPTIVPTPAPTTLQPTSVPTKAPTSAPTTAVPTFPPTASPTTLSPTPEPTNEVPTVAPTSRPDEPGFAIAAIAIVIFLVLIVGLCLYVGLRNNPLRKSRCNAV